MSANSFASVNFPSIPQPNAGRDQFGITDNTSGAGVIDSEFARGFNFVVRNPADGFISNSSSTIPAVSSNPFEPNQNNDFDEALGSSAQ